MNAEVHSPHHIDPSVTAAVDSIAIAGDLILLRAPRIEARISSSRHVELRAKKKEKLWKKTPDPLFFPTPKNP
uniref:Uncharacterized protein n=1 Tax=Utricularia reniformis TaxID=192314 RepID=A0A1Y0AZW4_9LAMI|nr:hypothetical protein AEK19_MT0402 [Utricularia reniformis]ART30671.1 hypothetical protein AEK19_MT0402 [Utricularia reniformis]